MDRQIASMEATATQAPMWAVFLIGPDHIDGEIAVFALARGNTQAEAMAAAAAAEFDLRAIAAVPRQWARDAAINLVALDEREALAIQARWQANASTVQQLIYRASIAHFDLDEAGVIKNFVATVTAHTNPWVVGSEQVYDRAGRAHKMTEGFWVDPTGLATGEVNAICMALLHASHEE